MRATPHILSAALLAATLSFAAPVQAQAALHYYQDPVYQKINPGEPHPMDDLISLAQQGDSRAQYILGDLYGKGQGGLGKNLVKARYWFEVSARNGYTMSFIRLAALAKHAKDPVSAYKWYTLGKSAAAWDSDEAKWEAAERDALVDKFKMTSQQISAAKDAADDWKDRQSDVEKQLRAQEQAAQDAAAKLEAAEAAKGETPDTDGDVNPRAVTVAAPAPQTPAKKKAAATAAPKHEQPQHQQENHYND